MRGEGEREKSASVHARQGEDVSVEKEKKAHPLESSKKISSY